MNYLEIREIRIFSSFFFNFRSQKKTSKTPKDATKKAAAAAYARKVRVSVFIPTVFFFYLDTTSTWHPTFILRPIFSIDPFMSSQDHALSNEVSIIILSSLCGE